MHITVDDKRYEYGFRHLPEWRPGKGEQPRHAHGRTDVWIREMLPRIDCPKHGLGPLTQSCTCELLRSSSESVYCSDKDVYDRALGRRLAFEKALNVKAGHRQGWRLSIFSGPADTLVRTSLWSHFLSTHKQAITLPGQPATRVYRKLILSPWFLAKGGF